MQISIPISNQLKFIAIAMMLILHLFNTLEYEELFHPIIYVGDKPLIYYVSLFCDACVPIFAFVSGYGLYWKYRRDRKTYFKGNVDRVKKLYINYWVVIFVFVIVLGYFLDIPGYPGSILKLFLNATALSTSYNGAWWFLTIYILFVVSSAFWYRLLDSLNPYLYVSLLTFIYVFAFYFRIYRPANYPNEILNWLHTQGALYFCTLFQFMLGALTLKYDWVKFFGSKINYNSILACVIILALFLFHAFVPNFIVAPLTGLGFVICYVILSRKVRFEKFLGKFTPHATNIWLIHMFFYLIYFRDFVYQFKYVPLIFLVLLSLCLVSSYILNYIIKLLTLNR